MGVNSLPKTVTRQRRGCDLNPGPTAQHANHSATEPPHLIYLMLFTGGQQLCGRSLPLTWQLVVVVVVAHLIADRGACVQDCGAGRQAGRDNKCVDCDGPCPKGITALLRSILLASAL